MDEMLVPWMWALILGEEGLMNHVINHSSKNITPQCNTPLNFLIPTPINVPYHRGKPNRQLVLNTVAPAKNRRLLLGVGLLPKCCHCNVGQDVFLCKVPSFRVRGLFPASS